MKSFERRVRKLERARNCGGEEFNPGAHFVAMHDHDEEIMLKRGYDEQVMENYSYCRMRWCRLVGDGCKNHDLFNFLDPFLWNEFKNVWDETIALFGRMPTRKDDYSGNEIQVFFKKRASEFSSTWAERKNNMKGKNFVVDPLYFERWEQSRVAMVNYLDGKRRPL